MYKQCELDEWWVCTVPLQGLSCFSFYDFPPSHFFLQCVGCFSFYNLSFHQKKREKKKATTECFGVIEFLFVVVLDNEWCLQLKP